MKKMCLSGFRAGGTHPSTFAAGVKSFANSQKNHANSQKTRANSGLRSVRLPWGWSTHPGGTPLNEKRQRTKPAKLPLMGHYTNRQPASAAPRLEVLSI